LLLIYQALNIFNYKVFKRVSYYLSLYIQPLFIFNKWVIVLALCCLLFFTFFHLLCVLYLAQEHIFNKDCLRLEMKKGSRRNTDREWGSEEERKGYGKCYSWRIWK